MPPDDAELEPSAPTAGVLTGETRKRSKRSRAVRLDPHSAPNTRSLEIPNGQAIKIRVVSGASEGKEFKMARPLMTIGRSGGEADIQIDDPNVSRLHCVVEVRRDAILLHDLRSKNGTFVDESQVFAARLKDKSQFRVGSSFLQIEIVSTGSREKTPAGAAV